MGTVGRCVGLTTLPPSYADCLEIWEHQTSETLKACLESALLLDSVNELFVRPERDSAVSSLISQQLLVH